MTEKTKLMHMILNNKLILSITLTESEKVRCVKVTLKTQMWVKVEKCNTFNKMKPQDEWHLGRVLNSHENNSFTRAELQYWKLQTE